MVASRPIALRMEITSSDLIVRLAADDICSLAPLFYHLLNVGYVDGSASKFLVFLEVLSL